MRRTSNFQYHQCSYHAREEQLWNKTLNAWTAWRHFCLTINVQMELMYLIWLFYQQDQRTTLCFMLLALLYTFASIHYTVSQKDIPDVFSYNIVGFSQYLAEIILRK